MEMPRLDYRIPQVVIAPLQGDDAKEIYEKVPKALRVNTIYDEKSKAVIGSTNLLAVGIDDVVEGFGLRALTLADLSLPDVMDYVRGKHYTDARALAIRSLRDSYNSNNDALLKRIYELAEEKQGSISAPFMIDGFSYVPNDSANYSVEIVTKPDFRVVQDERLDGKYNGQKFNDVDELGLPLFDRGGSRTWYAKNEGLSRLGLASDLNLYSTWYYLSYSDEDGRVVVLKPAKPVRKK